MTLDDLKLIVEALTHSKPVAGDNLDHARRHALALTIVKLAIEAVKAPTNDNYDFFEETPNFP